jgi:hypothetical protein
MRFEGAQPSGEEIAAIAAALSLLEAPSDMPKQSPSRWAAAARDYADDGFPCSKRY